MQWDTARTQECEEKLERQRKEGLELKRAINEEKHEKEALSKANEDLRSDIKKIQADRIALKENFNPIYKG